MDACVNAESRIKASYPSAHAALAALKLPNLDGVIVGKALYEGAVTIPAMKAVAGSACQS